MEKLKVLLLYGFEKKRKFLSNCLIIPFIITKDYPNFGDSNGILRFKLRLKNLI